MTQKITRKDLEELVKAINKILGKDSYTGYFLEYYKNNGGGYYLCYINQRGGKNDTEEDRYTAREMYAYLRGILTGIASR